MHENPLLSPELATNHIEAKSGSVYDYQTHSTTTSPHTDAEQGTPNDWGIIVHGHEFYIYYLTTRPGVPQK